MLSLLLAMSAAVETPRVETPRVVTLPKQARPAAVVRKRAVRKTKRARSAKLCVTGSCTPQAASPYRLTGIVEPRYSGKMDVVAKDSRMACGIQGAPVCPGRGTRLVSAPID